MNSFIKYPLVLGIVAALSGASLYATFKGTEKEIANQEKEAKVKALAKIFINGYGAVEEIEKDGVAFSKVWKTEEKTGEPAYYVTTGKAIGYNTAVPITLLVGFSAKKNKNGERFLLGWSVINSEETPGLGEKAKDEAAPYTIIEKITGRAKEAGSDRRTDFQKQFYNPEHGKVFSASELKIKKDGGDIDIITGATFSTQGIISAIKDADNKLSKVIN